MHARYMTIPVAVLLALGCGSDGDNGGGGPPAGNNLLAKHSGDAQTGTVVTQLAEAFCVRVTQSGSAVSGATVNWTTSSGGTLSVPSNETGADGTACSRLTLGQVAGSQSAQAAVSGASGSPVTFTATANAANATTLAKVGGDNQSANVGANLPEPLSVRVTDAFGNGVAGALVTWLVSSGSASLNPGTGNTNASGTATSVVTVNAPAGPIQITASASGLTGSPQTFNATGTTPTPAPNAITITVSNNAFAQQVDTVAAGGTVTWNWGNTGGVQHSVTSTGTLTFTSDPAGLTASPHSYGPITFNTPGTYFYYCELHGSPGNPPSGMSGTIVVQ